jgi:hypothetical protein
MKCKECKENIKPNFMLWNQICTFCWFFLKKYRGKTKKEAIEKRGENESKNLT